MAFLATAVFSDMEVNLNYLLKRFNEIPYIMRIIGGHRASFVEELSFEAYNQIEPTLKPRDKAIAEATREILTIMKLSKPWHVKVEMLAIILNRLKTRSPHHFSKRKIERVIRNHPIVLREDFHPNTLKMFEETFGTISSARDAKEFFKQWIEPRISQRETEKIREMLKNELKAKIQGGGKKKEWKGGGGGSLGETELKAETESPSISLGEEPRLSTSLSKPYEKIPSSMMNEAFWRRYWYKSRAERTIIQYLSESPNLRPVWSVAKYPDEWYVEDEIEKLDIEMSLDEGPLIPEVTTLKWVEDPALQGQDVISGFVPSSVTVLDASESMSATHDIASIAAFISYLSALKAGGQTSTVTFSTNYVVADWDAARELKELTLSMSFDEFTVFPAFEVMRLVSVSRGNCFIVIITDGGWQNIEEAISLLEKISEQGHGVFIFQLPGGDYPDRIELIRRSSIPKIYKVDNPETDLQDLVLSETMRTYKAFLT